MGERDEIVTVAVLESDMEAQMLDWELSDRGIPHVMVSYHSDAYDGLFQTFKGWGRVDAPATHRDEVARTLLRLREKLSGERRQ